MPPKRRAILVDEGPSNCPHLLALTPQKRKKLLDTIWDNVTHDVSAAYSRLFIDLVSGMPFSQLVLKLSSELLFNSGY